MLTSPLSHLHPFKVKFYKYIKMMLRSKNIDKPQICVEGFWCMNVSRNHFKLARLHVHMCEPGWQRSDVWFQGESSLLLFHPNFYPFSPTLRISMLFWLLLAAEPPHMITCERLSLQRKLAQRQMYTFSCHSASRGWEWNINHHIMCFHLVWASL